MTSTSSTLDQTLERRRSRFAQLSLGSVVTDQSCAWFLSSVIESRSELPVGTRSALLAFIHPRAGREGRNSLRAGSSKVMLVVVGAAAILS